MPEDTKSPQKRPKSSSESLEEEVINLLRKQPLTKAEISDALGHKRISGGLKKIFQNLLAEGVIAYTIPGKPRSRLQKYKLKNP